MDIRLFEPRDAQMAATMLAACTTDGLAVVVRGGGSKLTWGRSPRTDAFLSTRLLSSPIEHYPGDLVATVPAGATLGEVNRVLGRGGSTSRMIRRSSAYAVRRSVFESNGRQPVSSS